MRQLGHAVSIMSVFLGFGLAMPGAYAQGRYLPGEMNAWMVGGSWASPEGVDATGITLGYSIRGRLDVGFALAKMTSDHGAVTVDAVSPSVTAHLLRNPGGVPLSLSLSASAEWQEHSGNLGLPTSAERTAVGGAFGVSIYEHLAISRALSLVPHCTFSWKDLKVTTDRKSAYGVSTRERDTRSTTLGMAFTFGLPSGRSWIVLEPGATSCEGEWSNRIEVSLVAS